jgi:16S rRNA (cytidine1402-2'-O)-methyltransferase
MNINNGAMQMEHGRLYLIPALLGDSPLEAVMPPKLSNIVSNLRHFVVEDLRSARRFLKKISPDIDIDALHFSLLNEHTRTGDLPPLMDPLLKGHDLGLMSEAGIPCVADPGSQLVAMAHGQNIKVIPLSGPSSIILALMASGFNGQHFVFHGYLPADNKGRSVSLRRIEQDAFRNEQTQIFIETPYRNMKLFESIMKYCSPETRLCIAANLTTPLEMVRSLSIEQWKKEPPDIHKQPAVFLIYK